jgi:opacity protein-like surface antigen
MFSLARKLGLAILLAALCLGGRMAHAQSAPVQYWMPSTWFGFGGPGVLGLDGSDGSGGVSRANFPSGWFVGSTRNDFGLSGFNRAAAFGNFGSLSTEGVQFGYNFKNAPLSIYSGFDTLKYNTGPGSSASGAFAAFDRSATAPGAFSANAGIEYRPTSNLSLSLGVGVTQYQSQGLVDSDINSPLLPGQSPVVIGGRPLR